MTSFTCPCCWMTSYHPEDARHGYCGNCHWFSRDGYPCPLHHPLARPAGDSPLAKAVGAVRRLLSQLHCAA